LGFTGSTDLEISHPATYKFRKQIGRQRHKLSVAQLYEKLHFKRFDRGEITLSLINCVMLSGVNLEYQFH